MDGAALSSLITALVGGIVAIIGSLSALNNKKVKEAEAKLQEQLAKIELFAGRVGVLEEQMIAALSHIHRLEIAMAGEGLEVPARPKAFERPLPRSVIPGE